MDPTQQPFVDHSRMVRCLRKHGRGMQQQSAVARRKRWSVAVAGSRIAAATSTWYSRDGENHNSTSSKSTVGGTWFEGSDCPRNMGSGARTIVSLFRLKTRRGAAPLQPLADDEMQTMATELGGMAVLEVDEVSMIEKVVLAHMHLRFACYQTAITPAAAIGPRLAVAEHDCRSVV